MSQVTIFENNFVDNSFEVENQQSLLEDSLNSVCQLAKRSFASGVLTLSQSLSSGLDFSEYS